jgi:hypothetical protein
MVMNILAQFPYADEGARTIDYLPITVGGITYKIFAARSSITMLWSSGGLWFRVHKSSNVDYHAKTGTEYGVSWEDVDLRVCKSGFDKRGDPKGDERAAHWDAKAILPPVMATECAKALVAAKKFIANAVAESKRWEAMSKSERDAHAKAQDKAARDQVLKSYKPS